MACWCRGNCPHVEEPGRELKAGNQARAENLLRRNMAEAPFCVEGNMMLAGIMQDTNRASFAAIHIERAAETGGNGPRFWLERGRNLRAQGRPADAMIAFAHARNGDQDNPQAWAGSINAHEAANELAGAHEILALAQKHFKGLPPAVRLASAQLSLAEKDYSAVVNLLGAGLVPAITPAERLVKGRALEKLGDFALAWEQWTTAKRELHESGHVYWREHFMQLFAGLYEISQPARYKMLAPYDASRFGGNPIFVTGFPRSGTTLLETALDVHSEIAAGDEGMGVHDCTTMLGHFVHSPLPYPHSMMGLTLGDNGAVVALCTELYTRKTRLRLRPSADKPAPFYVTDKMPMNDLHLPLIRLMFPQAPFLYLRRHPLDILVSTMSHMITSGGHYAESLETIAEHYAGADGLLQHYKNVLPMGPFREVKYERLVADFEAELGAVMALADLELEPAQLDFHESGRVPRTISYSQVREPLYSSSVARFKNFLPWLEPALKWVGPIMSREGYEL